MDLSANNLAKILSHRLEEDALFRASLNIVLKNTDLQDALFVIGGSIYRTLVSALYHVDNPGADHDFLAQHVPTTFIGLNNHWDITQTSLGSPRLIHKGNPAHQIDFCRLNDAVNPWETNQPDPTNIDDCIASFLRRSPLDIQSFAFDWRKKVLYGEAGIRALIRKKVSIHNIDECQAYANRHKMTPAEFLYKKAVTLGFCIS